VDEQIGVVSRYVPSSMMAKRHIGSVTRARWPSFAQPGTFETNYHTGRDGRSPPSAPWAWCLATSALARSTPSRPSSIRRTPTPRRCLADKRVRAAVTSLWSVTIIVTVLYVGLVLRADNEGEGGILSLITLLRRGHTPSSVARTRATLASSTRPVQLIIVCRNPGGKRAMLDVAEPS
jgi:hypothetical protein